MDAERHGHRPGKKKNPNEYKIRTNTRIEKLIKDLEIRKNMKRLIFCKISKFLAVSGGHLGYKGQNLVKL